MTNNEIRNQQKDFVKHYLVLRKKNATQAAINAGYSKKTASSQASQLLKNPKVLEYLKIEEAALTQALWNEFTFDALEARKVLCEVMSNPMAKDSDRLAAAKDLLDRGGFKAIDKVEHSGEVGIPIADKKEAAKNFIKEMMRDE